MSQAAGKSAEFSIKRCYQFQERFRAQHPELVVKTYLPPASRPTSLENNHAVIRQCDNVCVCVSDMSFPPPTQPSSPQPSPPLPPTPRKYHAVIRRKCCETFQTSCNVPSILQRANHLATSQHLLNVPVSSHKRKFGAKHQDRFKK